MRCHSIIDQGKRVFIPGCMGGEGSEGTQVKDTAIRDLVSGIEYDGLKHNEAGWYLFRDGFPVFIPAEHALLIWKGYLTDWLIGEGYHSFNYVMEGDGEHVSLELYDKTYRVRIQSGVDTTLSLLVEAVMELSAEVRQ